MQRKTGATLDDLVEATGWLPHTTRAALTGLRKKGYDHREGEEPEGQDRLSGCRRGTASRPQREQVG